MRSRSTQRKKYSKSTSNPAPMTQQSLFPQYQTARIVENHNRNSYDGRLSLGSFYSDPRSLSSAGRGLENFPWRVSRASMSDVYYLPSPPTGLYPTNSGGRRPTNSQEIFLSRGTSIDDDIHWGEQKTEAITTGDNAGEPAYQSLGVPARVRGHSRGASNGHKFTDGWQQNRKTSQLRAPAFREAHSHDMAQKTCDDVRLELQRSLSDHSRRKSKRTDPREAERSLRKSIVVPSNVRQRRNAIAKKVDTHERPRGLYKGDRRYIQFRSGLWETVTVDNWNHWNSTWQVIDSSGRSMQAAPLALKTEEEYQFLSKPRIIGYRSFASSCGSCV